MTLRAPAAPMRAERRQKAHAAAPALHVRVGRVVVDGRFAGDAAASLHSAGLASELGLALSSALAGGPASACPSGQPGTAVQGLADALLPHLRAGLARGGEG